MEFKDKTLLITGGTGSFGQKMLNYFINNTDIKEVRIFPKIGNECFESIYLGVKIKEQDKDTIIKLAKKLNPNIKVYQMNIDPNTFSITENEIMKESLHSYINHFSNLHSNKLKGIKD